MAAAISRRAFIETSTAALLLAGAEVATHGALVGTAFAHDDDSDDAADGDDATDGDATEDAADDDAAEDALPALHVEGSHLVDPDGSPVQLRGVSTHGLAWYPEYVNEDCFRQLHDEWGATVVRLALYTADSGGWCTDGDRDELRAVIDRGVRAAVACGLYVIIDWHVLSEGDPRTYLEEACDFFDEMSGLYGELPNVLYEICNEPNGTVTWEDVCEYAEAVLPHVRAGAPDAVVLVGTPNWSQQLDAAAAAPLTCDDNLMYTLHFYAASHGENLRATLRTAVEGGLPAFVSEFGICDASGAGAIDEDSADEWVELMDELGVSYVAWNLSNKDETSAIIAADCALTSGFDDDDLSESGEWVVDVLEDHEGLYWEADEDGERSRDENDKNEKEDEKEEEDRDAEDAEDEEDDSEGSQAEASGAFSTDGLVCEWALRGAWMSEGRHFGNFDLTITNGSDELLDGWIVIVRFGQPVKLVNCWNGSYHECGTRIVATNKRYNATVYPGSATGGIGFIASAEDALEVQSIEVLRA